MIEITTERLKIKKFDKKYLEEYYQEFTSEITKFQYPDSFVNIKKAEECIDYFLDQMNKQEMLELMILTINEEFLGELQVFGLKEEKPELGLWLKQDSHGNGYGFEAVNAITNYLNVLKNYTSYLYEVDKRNTASIALINKVNSNVISSKSIKTDSGKELNLITYEVLLVQDKA